MRTNRWAWVLILASLLLGSATLIADTLYLRDGRQVHGRLVAVRNDTVEFEEAQGGWAGGRVVRFYRNDIRAIEFDQYGYGTGSPGYGQGYGQGYPAGPGGRPPGLREREVVVSANVQWIDTGIDVRRGQAVYIRSQGRVRWGGDRRDGPDGESNSPHNPNRPIPNRPGAALIGKVGHAGFPFFIGGGQGPFSMSGGGRLYLGINDDVLTDNSGNFRVVVFF